MNDRRIDKAVTALVDAIFSPLYAVMGVGAYIWNGWAGVIGLCVGFALFNLAMFGWQVWRIKQEAAA